jgi:hypothetical protein
MLAPKRSLLSHLSGLPPISSSWRKAPQTYDQQFSFQLNTCFHSPNVTSSLTRGQGLSFTIDAGPRQRAVILRSGSSGTHHILLSQIRDSPNLEGEVPIFIAPRDRVARLYPQALGSLFVAPYDSQGYGGGIRQRLHEGGQECFLQPALKCTVHDHSMI